MLGVRDRAKSALSCDWKEDEVQHLAQRKGDCSREREQRKKRRAILVISCVCSEYERCDCQQRSGECVTGCTVHGSRTGKEERSK